MIVLCIKQSKSMGEKILCIYYNDISVQSHTAV